MATLHTPVQELERKLVVKQVDKLVDKGVDKHCGYDFRIVSGV